MSATLDLTAASNQPRQLEASVRNTRACSQQAPSSRPPLPPGIGRVVDSIRQADERPVQRSCRIPNLSDSRDLKERVVLNQIVTRTAGKGGKWHLREIVAGRNQPIEFVLNSRAKLPE